MRTLSFTKRNLLEFLRNPLTLFFAIIFPLVMFFLFQIIMLGTGATAEMVPMFAVDKLIPSTTIFSFSFLALTISFQISKDRASAFQARLAVSPMRPIDFFLGYFLPCLIIASIQIILSYILGIIFGMTVGLGLILDFFILLLTSTFYISFGILIGSIFNEKSCGGISSIFVNITAIFSAMFFPLTAGTFKTILSFLPFMPSVELAQNVLILSLSNLLHNVLVVGGYTLLTVIASLLIFKKKLKKS